jgi:hypothetical protein
MPTLEDTIEFQAATLNDLLDADAKAVALPSEGEGKYRSWAYISTAAAGLLAILLVFTMLTGNGKGGGEEASTPAKDYPGRPVKAPVKLVSDVPSNVNVGSEVSLFRGGELVVAPAIVSQIIKPKSASVDQSPSVELAMTDEQGAAFNKVFSKGTEKGRVQAYSAGQPTAPAPATAATTAPPATTESTAPAPTPETTAPAATTTPSS